jgi:DNA-binding Lrp family transcriptional regulator
MKRPKLVTTSISKSVRDQVDADSLLQEALARGIVNVSAAARLLKPAVVSSIGRNVSEEAIITSLKRIKGVYRRRTLGYLKVIARSSVEVRTDLAMVSVEVDPDVSAKIKDVAFKNYDAFVQISSSPNAYSLVSERGLFGYLRGRFEEEQIKEAKTELAALIIHSPDEIMETPGCVAAIYNRVGRGGINVVDTVSNYTDTILVVRMGEVVKAFTAVTDLISEARGLVGGQR